MVGMVYERTQPRTTTVKRRDPTDPRQAGEVVAVRMLPDGDPIRLDSISDPASGTPDRTITVGSLTTSDIHIPKTEDKGVSDLHFLIHRDNGHTRIQDRSKNGTWIGRSGLHRATIDVFPGQVVEFGKGSQLLLCNELLEQCPADVIAATMDEFCKNARSRYGTISKVARFVGVPYYTLRDWYRNRRWAQKA